MLHLIATARHWLAWRVLLASERMPRLASLGESLAAGVDR